MIPPWRGTAVSTPWTRRWRLVSGHWFLMAPKNPQLAGQMQAHGQVRPVQRRRVVHAGCYGAVGYAHIALWPVLRLVRASEVPDVGEIGEIVRIRAQLRQGLWHVGEEVRADGVCHDVGLAELVPSILHVAAETYGCLDGMDVANRIQARISFPGSMLRDNLSTNRRFATEFIEPLAK